MTPIYYCQKCNKTHTFSREHILKLDGCREKAKEQRIIYCEHFKYGKEAKE